MDMVAVDRVRSFNRTVTQRIGTLTDRFLGRNRPLGEGRLLWEIGTEGIEIRALRARLNLDSGYMSRLLHALNTQGLLDIDNSPDDARVRRVRLTHIGVTERQELDRRAHEFAIGLLHPLSEQQRDKLTLAMLEVERLLTASRVEITIEDPRSVEARWCMAQYFAELNARFEAGFDPNLSISADASELRSPAGLLLLARLDGEPIGCAALKFHTDAPSEIKRMWVSIEARGLGLGQRLLRELETQAQAAGVSMLHLETNRALHEAIACYRKSGYREVAAFNDEPYAHHWFEKRLIGSAPSGSDDARHG
jgi:DNA-binding MarR family transcriptional regulator/GNAT superfamily N-acetyltransferase